MADLLANQKHMPPPGKRLKEKEVKLLQFNF